MGALKSLVVGLGVLIVIATGALTWGLYRTATNPETRIFTETPSDGTTAAAAAGAPATPFGDIRVPLPAGCSIAEMRPQGARLYLRIGPTGACERVIVIDTATGTVLGTVRGTP
jgi:hypothetical protein